MVIKGFCICGRQVSGGTDEVLPRHHRHVAGSVARGKTKQAAGPLPAGSTLVLCRSAAEAKIIR